jgi:hypothetical protein
VVANGANRSCRPEGRDGFEIAIICALTIERDPIEALLDKEYETDAFSYGKADGDLNSYTTGRLANNHVVIVYMLEVGITALQQLSPISDPVLGGPRLASSWVYAAVFRKCQAEQKSSWGMSLSAHQ